MVQTGGNSNQTFLRQCWADAWSCQALPAAPPAGDPLAPPQQGGGAFLG